MHSKSRSLRAEIEIAHADVPKAERDCLYERRRKQQYRAKKRLRVQLGIAA